MIVSRRAIIVGTGGHCRTIASLLSSSGLHKIIGILDTSNPCFEEVILGVPVIGSLNYLDDFDGGAEVDVFLALGNNKLREELWLKFSKLGFKMPNLISPFANVDPYAKLGSANVICSRAFIGPEVVMGDNNLINTAAVLEHEVRLGSHCHLASSSTVAGRSQIGDHCFVGAGATVINYVNVAPSTTIGAGATVVRNISIPGVYVGIPARMRSFR